MAGGGVLALAPTAGLLEARTVRLDDEARPKLTAASPLTPIVRAKVLDSMTSLRDVSGSLG